MLPQNACARVLPTPAVACPQHTGYQEDAAPVAAEPFRQCINGVWYEDPNAACDALNTYLRRAKKWDAGHLEARIRVDRAACYCRMCRTYITQGLGNLARPPGPRWHSCR